MFARAYPQVCRVTRIQFPATRELLDPADLHQEAALAAWLAHRHFDSERASLPTYLNHVVRNRIASLRIAEARRLRGYRGVPLDSVALAAAPERLDLRLDVARMLAAVPPNDRLIARYLREYSPAEASRELGVSRAAVYRAIGRLRAAFVAAGYHSYRHQAARNESPRDLGGCLATDRSASFNQILDRGPK